MRETVVDKSWFHERLREKGRSTRALARHLDVDPSAVSRMFSGQRRMRMDEANAIALFLGTPVQEVLRHVGVAIDESGEPAFVLLAATINQAGSFDPLKEPTPLPIDIISRAQDAMGRINERIIAAQVRASTGPLSLFDDAVILFRRTDIVEPNAIGALSICRQKSGQQFLARVTRARKTGEAFVQTLEGTEEVPLVTATPVLAIIP